MTANQLKASIYFEHKMAVLVPYSVPFKEGLTCGWHAYLV